MGSRLLVKSQNILNFITKLAYNLLSETFCFAELSNYNLEKTIISLSWDDHTPNMIIINILSTFREGNNRL